MFLIATDRRSSDADHFRLSMVRISVSLACTIVLCGLVSILLLRQPLWWGIALLGGGVSISVVTFQTLLLWYRPDAVSLAHRQKSDLREEEREKPLFQEETMQKALKETAVPNIHQIVAAFERPFQYMGVQTGEYRQEIEAAINALYQCDADQQRFSLCLHRLLLAAKQSWAGLAAFSPREREILELLLQNISYKEMSHSLHVSVSTIKTHVYHIFQKLGVSNREEAIGFILERGWFSPEEVNERPL